MTTPNNTRYNDDAVLYLRVAIDYAQAVITKVERGGGVSDDAFDWILTIKDLLTDVYSDVARGQQPKHQ